jgi:hypothetical protein
LKKDKKTIIKKIFLAILFTFTSALFWLISNNFDIAKYEGFDPLRYQYYAEMDLPEYLEGSSSYVIVLFLKYLYSIYPSYLTYVVFIALCVFIIIISDESRISEAAIISPVAYYYIAQTGKDGITILATAATFIIATKGINRKTIPLLLIMALSIAIRPAIFIILAFIYIYTKYGRKIAVIASIFISIIFYIYYYSSDIYSILSEIAANYGSGELAKLGREFTYGFSFQAVTGRLILTFFSILFQPFAALVKFNNGSDGFVIFEGFCQLIFLLFLFKKKSVLNFMKFSIPFVILISVVSPFYHFRYIAILYPVIFAIMSLNSSKSNIQLVKSKLINKNYIT